MEYIQGVELFEFINSPEVNLEEEKYLRYIFRKVIYAIYRLHQCGIAHRDIKAENIMIEHKGLENLMKKHWNPDAEGKGKFPVRKCNQE